MKKTILIIGGFLLLIVIVVGGYTYCQHQLEVQDAKRKEDLEKALVRKITSSYAKEVVVSKHKKLYRKDGSTYRIVGSIEEGVSLVLEDANIKTSSDKYFKIKNTEYYINYKNLQSTTIEATENVSDYISVRELKSNPTNLYKNDKLAITLQEEYTFDEIYIADQGRLVKFLDQFYYIKDNYEVINKENISVLKNLSAIRLDSSISLEKVEELFSYLQQEGYRYLTKEHYESWIVGNSNYQEKTVLILASDEVLEKIKDIANKYSVRVVTDFSDSAFKNGDQQLKVGDNTYYQYLVSDKTTLKRFKEILSGIKESVVTPVQSIAVLNYHFFYDANTESCNESICLSTQNFRKQLDYLKNNGYKTLTMQEFADWKAGRITLPKKSVLLTIDDGAMGTDTHLPAILEEYQMHASLFLITGWWDISKYQKSSYLEIYSHGNELHHNNYCNDRGCGFKPLLLSKEEIVADLNMSFNIVPSRLAFCYPFYKTNKNLEAALRETGVSIAFVGGNRKAKKTDSNYYLPRYVIYKNTSLNTFIDMIS